ncbi:hypothetical protein FS837_005738 [Tulasnella sp. UAMH 9824]|nr:hypothetical protein FS837_005738 [Tulasnella sp. UAMH 9824]
MPATLPPPPAAPAATRTEPRQKMSRSATSQSASQQPVPGRPRRSQSEDSSSQDIRAARAANARTKSHNAVPRADKDKPSQHADIIDQMDISGLGGGMFHHDGPFDAVAPSRNRQGKPHRAPVYAFEPGGTGPHNVPVVDKRLSPLAQATIAAMASSDGPYASANLLPAGDAGDSFPRGHRITPTRKMTLTEAWGKSEPEPFEEFSAGTIGNTGRGSARSSFDESGGYDGYSRRPNARRGESVDLPRRSKLPPPQPINLPGARAGGTSLDEPPSSPSYASDGYTKDSKEGVGRKKSILQRFRKMRENPNVPVLGGGNEGPSGYQSEGPYNPRVGPVREETEPYPPSDAPRNQNYYRGQQPVQGRYQQPGSPGTPQEPYVVVDGASGSRDKALPPPPGAAIPQANNSYFDRVAGADMTRKQSLYKKMKGAVVRNGAK